MQQTGNSCSLRLLCQKAQTSCCHASLPPCCDAFMHDTDTRLSADGALLPQLEEEREGGSAL